MKKWKVCKRGFCFQCLSVGDEVQNNLHFATARIGDFGELSVIILPQETCNVVQYSTVLYWNAGLCSNINFVYCTVSVNPDSKHCNVVSQGER